MKGSDEQVQAHRHLWEEGCAAGSSLPVARNTSPGVFFWHRYSQEVDPAQANCWANSRRCSVTSASWIRPGLSHRQSHGRQSRVNRPSFPIA